MLGFHEKFLAWLGARILLSDESFNDGKSLALGVSLPQRSPTFGGPRAAQPTIGSSHRARTVNEFMRKHDIWVSQSWMTCSSQEKIETIFRSMRGRCQPCYIARRGRTRYWNICESVKWCCYRSFRWINILLKIIDVLPLYVLVCIPSPISVIMVITHVLGGYSYVAYYSKQFLSF